MKKHISALLIFCMMLSLCAFGSVPAMAENWELPEGTQMFEPGCVMETEFGTFTVLDAGFAKKVENVVFPMGTKTTKVNGVTETHKVTETLYYTAEDGMALFVVKGILHNNSDTVLSSRNLHPTMLSGNADPVQLDAFPAVELTGSGTMSPGLVMDIEPDVNVEIDFACTIDRDLYFSSTDILLEFAGAALGFRKAGMKSYISMGFDENDGVFTADVTVLIDEKRAEKKKRQAEAALEPPHIDELRVENVSLEYNNTRNCYIIKAKVRNLAYPVYENCTLTYVDVSFRFLDANGDGIPCRYDQISNKDVYGHLPLGEAGWAGGYEIDVGTVDTAEAIVFDGYSFLYDQHGLSYAKGVKGSFTNPPVFKLDDIIPGRADAKKTAESDAVFVENVSVEFSDILPPAVMASSAYRAGAKKLHYSLTDSETYAVIHFTITNITTKEITLADLDGDSFFVELNFNNGFNYSTKSSKASVMQSGSEIAVMESTESKSTRFGDAIVIPPLVTYDVTVYIPCARLVATMTDKPLVVSFHTTQTGDKQIDVKVR